MINLFMVGSATPVAVLGIISALSLPNAMQNNVPIFFALFLVAGIFFGGNNAEGQDSQLSPQQQATVTQLIEEFKSQGYRVDRWIQPVENVTDPVLVGRYVVLSTEWLELVGSGRDGTVTRRQFQAWRNRIDQLYECYEKFMGHKPRNGDLMFIDLSPGTYWPDPTIFPHGNAPRATAQPVINYIRFNKDAPSFNAGQLREMRSSNLLSFTMMHEIGHVFTGSSRGKPETWRHADVETAANFLVYYALENCGFRFSGSGSPLQQRQAYIQEALKNLKNENIHAFPTCSCGGSAYDLYLCGLVDEVGWETLRKTIQSYHDGTYTPTKRYEPDREKEQTAMHVRAHEFFDRLAHFHGDAQVLRKGPDEGALLDQYFTVKTTPIVHPQRNAVRTAPTVTTPPRTPTGNAPSIRRPLRNR